MDEGFMIDSDYSIQKNHFSFEIKKKTNTSRKNLFSLVKIKQKNPKKNIKKLNAKNQSSKNDSLINFYGLFFNNLTLFCVKRPNAAGPIDDSGLFEEADKTVALHRKTEGLWKRFKSLFKKKKAKKGLPDEYQARFRRVLRGGRLNRVAGSSMVYPGLREDEVVGFEQILQNSPFHECAHCRNEKILIQRMFQKDVIEKTQMWLHRAELLMSHESWRQLDVELDKIILKKYLREFEPRSRMSPKKIIKKPVKRVGSKSKLRILNRKMMNKIQNTGLFLTKFHKNKRILLKQPSLKAKSWIVRKWVEVHSGGQNRHSSGGNSMIIRCKENRNWKNADDCSTKDEPSFQYPTLRRIESNKIIKKPQNNDIKLAKINLNNITNASKRIFRKKPKLSFSKTQIKIPTMTIGHLTREPPSSRKTANSREWTNILSNLELDCTHHVLSTRNYNCPKSNSYIDRFMRTSSKSSRFTETQKEKFFRSKLVKQPFIKKKKASGFSKERNHLGRRRKCEKITGFKIKK